jgi:hypothetical protein
MAINDQIAAGVKPIQIENPLNNMAKFYNIRNDMQTNQMNQMTMAEAERKQGQAAQYRNALSNLGDPSSEGYEERRAQAYYNNADPAGYQAIRTSELANQKTQGDIQKQKEELGAQTSRDLSRSSTDANVTAWFEDAMNSRLFNPDEKVKITNEYGRVMAIPVGEERAAYLRSKGQSAAEAKSSTIQQDVGGSTNIVSIPASGGAPTVLSSTKKTLNPEQALGVPVGYDEGSISLDARNKNLDAKLVELNNPKTTPERAKALEGEIQQDRRSISAQQQDQESMRLAAKQAKEPRQELENLLRDRAALVAKLGPAAKNDPVVNGMTARINYLTTHPDQLTADPRRVHDKIESPDGTVTFYNIYGQKLSQTGPGAGKGSAQYAKTKEQARMLGQNVDIALEQIGNALKPGGLLDKSTASGIGRGVDIGANLIGKATPGAIAAAELAPIADLAVKLVTRFEGSQSNADVADYKRAAGQLADPTLPVAIRRAAGEKVMEIMKRRKGQFITPEMAAQGEAPAGGGNPHAGKTDAQIKAELGI